MRSAWQEAGWLADPELGRKAQNHRGADVVPCILCMRCHDSACIDGTTLVCSVNPRMGVEHNLLEQRPLVKKRVAVVGGGPAGMVAALTLARRGHEVTLFEQSGQLGGQLNFADYAPFKSALAKYKSWLIAQVEQSPIAVRLNCRPDAGLLKGEEFQGVVAALGAQPIVLPIPGSADAIPAPQIFGGSQALGQRVTIVGGGQVGCEAALYLAQMGKQVTVLEMQDKVLSDASPSYRSRLMRNLTAMGEAVTLLPGARCTAMGRETTYVTAEGTTGVVEGDSVVLSAGMQSETDQALALYDSAYGFYLVGDCQKPGNVQKAVRSAYSTAMQV